MPHPFVGRSADGRPRLRAALRVFGQFAVFLVVLSLLVSFVQSAWAFLGSARPTLTFTAAAKTGSLAIPLLVGLLSLAAALSSVWLTGRYLDRRRLRDFGFHLNAGWWLDLSFGFFLGALLMSGVFLVQLAFGWVSVNGTFQTVEPGNPFLPSVFAALLTFSCVGFYEELVYRGYQITNLAEGLNLPGLAAPRVAVVLAWIFSSYLFGVLHGANPGASPLSAVNITLAGLMLGVGYVLSGELAIPIGLHIAWNFFQGNVYGFPVSGLDPIGATFISTGQRGPELWTGGAFGPEGGLLVPLATLTGCLLIALWVRLRQGEVGIHTPLAQGPKQDLSGERAE